MAEKVKKESKISRFFKRIGKFVKNIILELKKVAWPNRKQVVNNTVSVLVCCLFIGAIIWVVDVLLKFLLKLVF